MNQKGKRKNMLMSSLILVIISFISIVGTTFALFTNDPKDGTISVNVVSGKIEMDIVDTNQDSLIGEKLYFVGASEKYFEPGVSYYTQGFQVYNKGNIPINYNLRVSPSADYTLDELEDSFDFYLTTEPKIIEEGQRLSTFKGSLDPNEYSETYYLIMQMKPGADNEFMNKSFSGIGVSVYAVQGNSEF